jgi:hypothetical protein
MMIELPSVMPVRNQNFLWGHRQPECKHPVHSLVLLSMEQVPNLLNAASPGWLRLRLTVHGTQRERGFHPY